MNSLIAIIIVFMCYNAFGESSVKATEPSVWKTCNALDLFAVKGTGTWNDGRVSKVDFRAKRQAQLWCLLGELHGIPTRTVFGLYKGKDYAWAEFYHDDFLKGGKWLLCWDFMLEDGLKEKTDDYTPIWIVYPEYVKIKEKR